MTTKVLAKPAKAGERMSKFVRGTLIELKKVHWPNRNELIRYTGIVILAVVIVAAVIWIVDSLLSFLLGFIL